MSTHRDALSEVMYLCGQAEKYTSRICKINDAAMRGLGMTQNQRDIHHNRLVWQSRYNATAEIRQKNFNEKQARLAKLAEKETA